MVCPYWLISGSWTRPRSPHSRSWWTLGDWEGLKWHYHFKQSKYACFIDFRPPEPLPAPLTVRLSGAGEGAGAEAGDPRPAVFWRGPAYSPALWRPYSVPRFRHRISWKSIMQAGWRVKLLSKLILPFAFQVLWHVQNRRRYWQQYLRILSPLLFLEDLSHAENIALREGKQKNNRTSKIGWKLLARSTACGHKMAHRIWIETKLQPGTAGTGNMLGGCLVSFHFWWAILCPQAVQSGASPHLWYFVIFFSVKCEGLLGQ